MHKARQVISKHYSGIFVSDAEARAEVINIERKVITGNLDDRQQAIRVGLEIAYGCDIFDIARKARREWPPATKPNNV